VIPIVEQPLPLGDDRVDRVELDDVDAALPQAVEIRRWGIHAAEAVIDHIDLHAPLLL